MKATKLKRSLGIGALLFYGIGDILGAGIYALIGKVANEAGSYTWMAFVAAFTVAILTGLSYAELIAKYPKSAGASYYVGQAFKSPKMPLLVGWFVSCASIVSLAAAARAFSGYFQQIAGVPEPLLVLAFVATLSLINFRGINQSSLTNMICTVIEGSGLLLIIVFGLLYFDKGTVEQAASAGGGLSIMIGASLAFYAFMGFEDMANVAEEAKNPTRDIPIAIITSLLVAGVVYGLIGWIATRFAEAEDLADASAPLVLLAQKIEVPLPTVAFTCISLFAVANTALLNAITGSRLLYGLAQEGLLHKKLGQTHTTNKTPSYAILLVALVAGALGVVGSVEVLAGATSLLLLLTFCLVHVALIKLRDKKSKGFKSPMPLPYLGILTTLTLIGLLPSKQQLLGFGLVVLGGGLVYFYAEKKL